MCGANERTGWTLFGGTVEKDYRCDAAAASVRRALERVCYIISTFASRRECMSNDLCYIDRLGGRLRYAQHLFLCGNDG